LPVGNFRRYVFLVARPACPAGRAFLWIFPKDYCACLFTSGYQNDNGVGFLDVKKLKSA